MRAILSAKVPVSCVAVFAEMAWMERRPELGLLCRAARDHGNIITTATVQSALSGLPDAGANNVIAWCQVLGLCDARGGLTSLGQDVAESDEAPVPEQGIYCLWLAQHPVIGRRVLTAERLTSTRDHRFESIRPLPYDPERRKVFRSVLNGKERFIVRDLPTNHGQSGGDMRSTRATCRLRWTLDFDHAQDQWQLDGAIESPQGNGKHELRPMKHEPESDGLDLWNLISVWTIGPLAAFGRWQATTRQLAVSFNALTEAEINTFRKTLSLGFVEIPGKGAYEDVTIEDVPIGPWSADDAQQWAMARFAQHLLKKPAYRSRAEVRALFAELTEDTPLEQLSPTLPSHADLLAGLPAQSERDQERFWSLAAAVDLAPSPVSCEDLGPLRIGSPAPESTTESPSLVRIPYRGGWSMQRLVDRLLAGTIPQKVLLCDRYVRGDDNLNTLKILVAAFHAAAPNIAVEVWTGEEGADVKKIKDITLTPPRSYREAFGQNLLHDRYLLVRVSQEQGFGWHMSNSPLHARATAQGADPETPLRWKDLAATRVTVDALEPSLRHWLTGSGR
jgi:hypothetical protein